MQLYANVLPRGKYAGQRQKEPFKINLVFDDKEWFLKGGLGGQYMISDLEFFAFVNGVFTKIDFIGHAPNVIKTIAADTEKVTNPYYLDSLIIEMEKAIEVCNKRIDELSD